MNYTNTESFAREMDAADPLRPYREQFFIPTAPDGETVIYLCGNSLGLQPRATRAMLSQELDDWAQLGVEAHFDGARPWYSYHEQFRELGARLVGAMPGEVVMMNSLTVNLHLMMVSFYRPTRERYKILIDYPTFPSDTYAVKSQIIHHGLDPSDALVVVQPRDGEHTLRVEDIEAAIEREGDSLALVLLAGVNFFTGQFYDIPRITRAAHGQGAVMGVDLAHAAGNVPLALHAWNVDFACWCSYKYLNSGPGAVAGCFVHERHGESASLPRFAGWWGNDPSTRFRMHLQPDFVAREGADGWQLSNPPIMALAPVLASMRIFDDVGMAALREKSEKLTGYLEFLLDQIPDKRYEVITPRDPAARGCQLSILAHDEPKALFKSLQERHVIGDFREPNVIRVAPTPLYNSFEDVWRFVGVLSGES
ncbi:MAG TPA: kynureninase [Phycisphaerae bacterium]|nr:kynureninase [Phycisphaerae bacterium]HRW55477.1 kynureninase [Phycisphaerae bacterium]